MTQLEYAELALKLRAIDNLLKSQPTNPALLKDRLEVVAMLVWT